MTPKHQPVLLDDTIRLLAPAPGEAYLDCTAGYGGHAQDVIDRIGDGRAVLVDRDRMAVTELNRRFGSRAEIVHSDYASEAESLVEDGSLFDLILLDLGVSSPQIDDRSRGFSFKGDAPLDMRMDQTQVKSALDVVNKYPEKQLADIIRRYGEERRWRAVARAIVSARPLAGTGELAETVRRVVGRSGDIDPATRTFQAIRIEVNQELSQLETALPLLVRLLTPGGRIAVISFHSLEDRIVKEFFATENRDCICPPKQPVCTCGHRATLDILTRKAVKGETNDANNPRARSAKLRAAVKLTPKQKREGK